MNDRQMQQRVRQAVDSRLSGLAFDPLLARRVALAAERTTVPIAPRRRLTAAMLLALLLAALTATAAASGLLGDIFGWLRDERSGAARLGRMTAATESFGQATVGGVTFTCAEALADDRSFLCSVIAEGADGCAVTVDAAYQGHTLEIIHTATDEEGRVILIGEGMHGSGEAGPMLLTLTVRRDGETETGTLAVTPRAARTLETRTLAAPVDLGDTGYRLETLTLRRTELRTYLDHSVSVGLPPLSIALKRPRLVLVGPDGAELESWWPFDAPMPDPIRVQLRDGDGTELLFETTLAEQEWKEETP